MDNFRAFEDSGHIDLHVDDEPAIEAPPEIGVDERRMHVRAYNYWVSLLDGRSYPRIQDLDPASIEDFGPNSVLLDFSDGSANPAVAYLGGALRTECGLPGAIGRVSDVPARSLISRLTDHYLQIIANCAPIGFEAEFVSQQGQNTMYRGILMPFTSDGETIDFIYGVINWKVAADTDMTANLVREVSRAVSSPPSVEASPIWADGPNAEPLDAIFASAASAELDDELALGVGSGAVDHADQPSLELGWDDDAGLADRLHTARESAEAVKNADVRSRGALYRALGEAYDFALAADETPDDLAELLDDAGIKAQLRAPMTPIVKLIFGADYDKTRLTEFAAALSHGRRQNVAPREFGRYLEGFEGGLKGIVQAERRERRPAAKPDRAAEARQRLGTADPIAFLDLDIGGDSDFVLLIARREQDGSLAIVAPVEPERALLDRALCKAAA